MNFLLLAGTVIGIFAVCLVAMAVGVIIRNKTFTSCGCASLTYRGEKIRCPGCTDRAPDEAEEVRASHRSIEDQPSEELAEQRT